MCTCVAFQLSPKTVIKKEPRMTATSPEIVNSKEAGKLKEKLSADKRERQREGGINPLSYIKRNTIRVMERWDALK